MNTVIKEKRQLLPLEEKQLQEKKQLQLKSAL